VVQINLFNQYKTIQNPRARHADGICHVYVEKSAVLNMAKNYLRFKSTISISMQFNETLLIDKEISKLFAANFRKIKTKQCKNILKPKTWKHEYGDLTCAVKVVKNKQPIAIKQLIHISSHHTDTM